MLYIFFDKLPGNIININFRPRASKEVLLTDLLDLQTVLDANPIPSLPEAAQTVNSAVMRLISVDPSIINLLRSSIGALNGNVSTNTWTTAQTLLNSLNVSMPDRRIVFSNLNNLKAALQIDPYQGSVIMNTMAAISRINPQAPVIDNNFSSLIENLFFDDNFSGLSQFVRPLYININVPDLNNFESNLRSLKADIDGYFNTYAPSRNGNLADKKNELISLHIEFDRVYNMLVSIYPLVYSTSDINNNQDAITTLHDLLSGGSHIPATRNSPHPIINSKANFLDALLRNGGTAIEIAVAIYDLKNDLVGTFEQRCVAIAMRLQVIYNSILRNDIQTFLLEKSISLRNPMLSDQITYTNENGPGPRVGYVDFLDDWVNNSTLKDTQDALIKSRLNNLNRVGLYYGNPNIPVALALLRDSLFTPDFFNNPNSYNATTFPQSHSGSIYRWYYHLGKELHIIYENLVTTDHNKILNFIPNTLTSIKSFMDNLQNTYFRNNNPSSSIWPSNSFVIANMISSVNLNASNSNSFNAAINALGNADRQLVVLNASGNAVSNDVIFRAKYSRDGILDMMRSKFYNLKQLLIDLSNVIQTDIDLINTLNIVRNNITSVLLSTSIINHPNSTPSEISSATVDFINNKKSPLISALQNITRFGIISNSKMNIPNSTWTTKENIISSLISPNNGSSTTLSLINNLRTAIQASFDKVNAAKNSINNALDKLDKNSVISPTVIENLRVLLPQVIFYGNPDLVEPANTLYFDLFVNISSNVFFNILAPQLCSILVGISFKMIPVVNDMVEAFKIYDFSQIFYVFWYNALIQSIIVFVFYLIVLNTLGFIKYAFNTIVDIFLRVEPFQNKRSSDFQFRFILYMLQIAAAFGLSKWAESASLGWSSQAFIGFYFNKKESV